MENPNYYAVIPASVRYDKNLKPMAKLLYGEISALAQKDGKCWATNAYFADLYDLSKETISRLISDLVSAGYIKSEIIYKEGTKEIANRYLKICGGGLDEKVKSPLDEKVKENNTRMNNTRIIKENILKEKPPVKANKFVRPSKVEIQEYIAEKNLNVDADSFYDYFEATGWIDSKGNHVKSWKGKLQTWSGFHKQERKRDSEADEVEKIRMQAAKEWGLV